MQILQLSNRQSGIFFEESLQSVLLQAISHHLFRCTFSLFRDLKSKFLMIFSLELAVEDL